MKKFRITIEAFDGVKYTPLLRQLNDGKLLNISELCRLKNIDARTVHSRLERKTPAFQAFTDALDLSYFKGKQA